MKEFMRILHFTGKFFGHRKVEFKNYSEEDSFSESISFMGFSVYKVSQNNLRSVASLMNKGVGFFDERIVAMRKRIELEKDDSYGDAQNEIEELREKITDLQQKNSKLSSAVLNLKYSARTVIEDFDDIELEESK